MSFVSPKAQTLWKYLGAGMSPVVSSFVQYRLMRSSSYKSAVNGGLRLDSTRPPNTYNLSPRIVVVAPTRPCGSLPVALCTLHTKPDRFVDPVPLICDCTGTGEFALGDLLGRVAASCSCCPLGLCWFKLDSLLFVSAR